jgi:hypothetical protein
MSVEEIKALVRRSIEGENRPIWVSSKIALPQTMSITTRIIRPYGTGRG